MRSRHDQRNHWRGHYFKAAGLGVLLSILSSPVAAQTQVFQAWPEVDNYLKVNSYVRISFFAALTRENREGTNAELGPNIDYFVKPLAKLKRITVFQLDQSKERPLMLRAGYRYMPSTSGPTENRGVFEVTGRFPLACIIHEG